MGAKHWFGIAVLLFLGYLLGVKFPSFGHSALAKVGM